MLQFKGYSSIYVALNIIIMLQIYNSYLYVQILFYKFLGC